MKTVTDIVASQYNSWTYPEPISDMLKEISEGYYEHGAPNLFTPLLWPERKNLKGLRILIAGCGTNQASYNALSLPDAHITAVDISLASLQHSQYLIEKHKIKNVTHYHMSLLDIEKLNSKFDLIICGGVLHHMEKPGEGLQALRDVLVEDGVMSLMLYGQYLRQGVYILQEVFKRLGCSQSQQDIDFVRNTLENIPQTHPIHSYIKAADDLKYDTGIIDTFLHPQDRAYTVPEILEFVQENGLKFLDWEDRCNYSATALMSPGAQVQSRLNLLNEEERWPIVELLNYHCGTHRFFVGHPNQHKRIDFTKSNWKDFVPNLRPRLEVIELGNLQSNKSAKLKRNWHEFSVHRIGISLLQNVNGERSINEIIELAKNQVDGVDDANAQAFFSTMHDWGHLMYWFK